MILFRNFQNLGHLSVKTFQKCPVLTSPYSRNTITKTKPVQLILKRNASIHTRSILIQKLKLEHINNWGVALIVS